MGGRGLGRASGVSQMKKGGTRRPIHLGSGNG